MCFSQLREGLRQQKCRCWEAQGIRGISAPCAGLHEPHSGSGMGFGVSCSLMGFEGFMLFHGVWGVSAPQWALRDLCLQHLPHTGSSMSFRVFLCAPQWALGFLSSSGSSGVFLCAPWGALGHLCSGCWNTSNWGLSLPLSLWFWTRGRGVLGLCVAQGCPPLNPSVLSQGHSGSGTPQGCSLLLAGLGQSPALQ